MGCRILLEGCKGLLGVGHVPRGERTAESIHVISDGARSAVGTTLAVRGGCIVRLHGYLLAGEVAMPFHVLLDLSEFLLCVRKASRVK